MNLGALGLCAFLSAGVGGSFHEAIAALKVGAAGLWVAALGLFWSFYRDHWKF